MSRSIPLQWDYYSKKEVVKSILEVAKRHKKISNGKLVAKDFSYDLMYEAADLYSKNNKTQPSHKSPKIQLTKDRIEAIKMQICFALTTQTFSDLWRNHHSGAIMKAEYRLLFDQFGIQVDYSKKNKRK